MGMISQENEIQNLGNIAEEKVQTEKISVGEFFDIKGKV